MSRFPLREVFEVAVLRVRVHVEEWRTFCT